MSEKHLDYIFRVALIGGILCLLTSVSITKSHFIARLPILVQLIFGFGFLVSGIFLLLLSSALNLRTILIATKKRRERKKISETPLPVQPGVWPPAPKQDANK